MKRKLFCLIAALVLCGTMWAQDHYAFNLYAYENNMPVIAQIKIDGVAQTSTQIELGAFVGTSVRGSDYIRTEDDLVYIQVYYDDSGETVSFKIFNHEGNPGVEYTNCSTTVTTKRDGWGSLLEPLVLNFVTTQSFNKEITAYTPNGKDNYYLLASPIGEVDPDDVQNMRTNNFDLYYFDQTASDGLEWINIKDGNTNLMPCKGYLYANSENVNISFNGTPYDGDGQITLTKASNTQFEGWNLVGNPFPQTAYITKPFYVMNATGTNIEPSSGNSIEVMEGVFVEANTDGETLTFSTTEPTNSKGQIVLNVNQNRNASIDRAIVRFDESQALPKITLNPNNTKLCFPQGNDDFAIVSGKEFGDIPVNFKAAENGTYTINVDVENIELDYLHLIDNKTGADIDLLVEPSYTFTAKKSDYASRFKLVFSGSQDGDSTGSATFAYFNGSEWQISNMGEATLQVVDVTGRIVKNETISGYASISINEAPGVYMMRLVSGNDVKVQKVVVR